MIWSPSPRRWRWWVLAGWPVAAPTPPVQRARSITVVNRTVAKAEALAKDFPDLVITCCGLDQLDAQLAANTLLFTSTGADDPIINRSAPRSDHASSAVDARRHWCSSKHQLRCG